MNPWDHPDMKAYIKRIYGQDELTEQYLVEFTSGGSLWFEDVTVMEAGWLSCYFRHDGEKHKARFPPGRIKAVHTTLDGPATDSLADWLDLDGGDDE